MSFSLPILQLIAQARTRLVQQGTPKPLSLLSLGYPDMLLRPDQIVSLFGQEVADNLKFREDSERIIQWHGLAGKLEKVIDAEHFLQLIGITLYSVDIVADRGCEIILDLNDPLPEHMRAKYDIVLDGGTTEHCFNIGQAIKNVAEMVRVGGVVIQGNGLNNYNHGFYGINPTAYHDFYTQNGFTLHMLRGFSRRNGPIDLEVFDLPLVQGFSGVPELTGCIAVAERTSDAAIQWPMQSKYLMTRK